ncbi:hypothetical protein M0G43_14450 [Subsaxibacter sp. CAU 1640]|uniref:hypothetical protein n=1 Tax=Subsaxibacter sp. CAU 1640 TaxID=2933271 RepID=UPI002006CB5C|nr:hypothetical protein [Subsaxibacter sp. CAU 1640]MCK7591787.1 hypothetical protein [Subsaxibacter sp. CAU 1640]
MKNSIILFSLLTIFIGCKNNEKQQDENLAQPNSEETNKEKESDAMNKLEVGCYVYKADGTEVKMEVTNISNGNVRANLYYSYAEKDKNEGTLLGKINGDKLFGQYTFMSEGVESVRDVAFKIEKDQIVEGFGDVDEGGTRFKDTTNLSYNTTTPWKKAVCD